MRYIVKLIITYHVRPIVIQKWRYIFEPAIRHTWLTISLLHLKAVAFATLLRISNILQTSFYSPYWYLSLKKSTIGQRHRIHLPMESKGREWYLILQWSITLFCGTCRGLRMALKLPNFRSIKKLFVEVKNESRWRAGWSPLLTRRTMRRH